MKDGGALIVPTDFAIVGELAIQAHTLGRRGVQIPRLDFADPLLHPRRTGGDRHLEVHPVVGVEVHRGIMTALDGEGRRPHESLVGELF